MLPINYESWHQMPDSNKNEALDNIKKSRIIMSRRHWEKDGEFIKLEQVAGKNRNSLTQLGRKVLLV
ncbi:hypothetical protein Gotur_018289 [Gossypium turneri]